MAILISYKYQIQGAEDVKKKLKEINAEYDKGELSIDKYRQGLSEINRDAKALNQTQNISKNLYLATHPALNRLTRGISVFGSVSRTALSIMNSLNLSNLTSVSVSSQRAQADADVAQAQRELSLAISKYGTDSIEAADAQDKLNVALAKQKEVLDETNNQKFDGIITAIAGLGTAISTTFSLLMSNATIRDAVIRAGSFLGGVFGGFFTLISRAAISALDWLFPSLTGANALKGSAAGGSRLGTIFGLSFAGAASVAIIAVGAAILAGALDIMMENVSGQSFVRTLTEKLLGEGKGMSTKDILGLNTYKGADLSGKNIFGTGPNDYDTYIKESGFGNKDNKAKIDEQVSFFQPLIDLFTKGLPEAYGETETKFNDVFTTNIPDAILATTPVVREGFKSLWNGVIELTNAAGAGMVSATNSIFKSLINSLNSMISAYNRAASKIGKSTVGKVSFSPINYTPIPTIAAANGFDGIVNRPTLFLTGEAGPEHVAVTPSGKNSGVTIVQQITVQGSILSERELGRITDRHFKDALLKVGFRKPITG